MFFSCRISGVQSLKSSTSSDRFLFTADDCSEIVKLHNALPGLEEKYLVEQVIGSGTFSAVFKAKSLTTGKTVALKQVYVSANQKRLVSEITILHALRNRTCVTSLIEAFREQDQVLLVLPYSANTPFSEFFQTADVTTVRLYMHNLFVGIAEAHSLGIIHRDIKPGNFCWDDVRKKGVLVDFGLAEWDNSNILNACLCTSTKDIEVAVGQENYFERVTRRYIKEDTRPIKKANRDGTRGFRAPEVLLRCQSQSKAIDIWSSGVILLSFLTKRYPFFKSDDDICAFIELCHIFGKEKMVRCAILHECHLEISLPSVYDERISFDNLIKQLRAGSTNSPTDLWTRKDYSNVLTLLEGCLEVDSRRRWSAEMCLQSSFLKG